MVLGMLNCSQAFILTADGQVLIQDLTLPWVTLELGEDGEDEEEIPVYHPIRLIKNTFSALAA